MFICSMKMSKKKIVIGVLAGLVLVGIVVCLVAGKAAGKEKPADAGQSASLKVKDTEDIAEYVRSFGWEIESEPCEVVEVTVPEEFNDVYQNYNELQKKQGFDLEAYKGKLVQRTTFVVTNYPNYPENIRADVLTCDGVIVAADICSIEIAGFMHGMNETRS